MGSSWRYAKYRSGKFRRRLLRAACSRLYCDWNKDIRQSVLVAGTGRSGTTWLADIIASQTHCRTMFEPFHSGRVRAFEGFHYFHYMRPRDSNDELLNYCQRVFSGDIRDSWIDRQVEHIFPRGRVIKDIRANLFLKWIQNRFPEMPLIYIIRHPCAVVLSRLELGWATDTDIAPFLVQERLVEDFLYDKVEFIREVKTDEEKHAIIWCISNLVPIRQFGCNELHTVFYEDLCLNPEEGIPRIFQSINQEFKPSVFRQLRNPSTTSIRDSAVVIGENRVARWKKTLSGKQIRDILSVVEAFGLNHLYDSSLTPVAHQG
jgi:hypothetical protein